MTLLSTVLSHQERDSLEAIIDRYGLGSILNAIQGICEAKAEHVHIKWQDKERAKRWEYAASCLDKVTDDIVEQDKELAKRWEIRRKRS